MSVNRPSLINSIKPFLKRFAGQAPGQSPSGLAAHSDAALANIKYQRFLTNNPMAYQSAIEAAETYASKLGNEEHEWLYAKPFDTTPGNPQYFRLMFDLLNILQAMRLPHRARILEIGSGPGWVTEILLTMGFSVDALEPSADLINIAKERCATARAHFHQTGEADVRFHQSTLEEIDFPEQHFDAILYFDVLHHVVDEVQCMTKSFRFLKEGGCLGVIDPSWHPDFKTLENQMIGEMAKYGTLENPFSVEYIDYLLAQAGFVEIERYISVNGLFTEKQSARPLGDFSDRPMRGSNNMTARRPDSEGKVYPGCANSHFKTDVRLTLLACSIDPVQRQAVLQVNLENTGETLLDCNADHIGHITFSMRQGMPGSPEFVPSENREVLAQNLPPGKSLKMTLKFTLPAAASLENWELDMIAEGVFWFSTRGIPGCPVVPL
jgi:2-polyprenyl-3-methyl-5-hydroxy-6-metoxy-1,4-benzoquinol methylase